MAEPFSLSPERCASVAAPALREEILARTQNAAAADQILRSIVRFGIDPTIERFDVTPQAMRATVRVPHGVAWNVKAVRAPRPVEEIPVD